MNNMSLLPTREHGMGKGKGEVRYNRIPICCFNEKGTLSQLSLVFDLQTLEANLPIINT